MAKTEVGRNDPCPCGAVDEADGTPKKFKRCCGRRVRTWLFNHPDLKDLKDVKAVDVESATEAFSDWFEKALLAGKLPPKVRPFAEGKVYAEDDERAVARAENYVKIETRTVGTTCATCNSPTFTYVFKGGTKAACVPCFLKAVGAPQALVDAPRRVKGFYYNEGGHVTLDLEDEDVTPALAAPPTPPPAASG